MQREQISDWGIKIGSLALAVLLWLHAVTEHTYEKSIDIDLVVEDPHSEPAIPAVIVGNVLPEKVRVMVSGPGKDLLQLNPDIFKLRLQTEGEAGAVIPYRLEPGDVESDPTELDVQIKDVVAPDQIEVVLDRRVERRVAVGPIVELETAEAYTQVGQLRIEPAHIEISGPQGHIDTVQVIYTDSLLLREVEEDVVRQLMLRKPEGIRIDLNPVAVTVTADIQILAEDEIGGIPVEVRYAGERTMVTNPPRVQVKVRGGVDVVANLETKAGLKLYVDYREYSGESLLVRAEEDSFFEVRSISPAKVDLVEK